jgi:hypothetical protein
MFCLKCGRELPDEAKFCAYCGAQINSTTNQIPENKNPQVNTYQSVGAMNYNQNRQPINFNNAINGNKGNEKEGFGIAALILGILSIIFSFTMILSIIMGLIAVIFGIIHIAKKSRKGLGVAGIITGVFGIIISIAIIVCIAMLASEAENGRHSFDYNFNYNNKNNSNYYDEYDDQYDQYDDYDNFDTKGQNL